MRKLFVFSNIIRCKPTKCQVITKLKKGRCFSTSYDQGEVDQFQKMGNWWGTSESAMLLRMYNTARIPFIVSQCKNHFNLENSLKPLSSLNCIDIGCGGGIATESLARLGGNVIGIDPTPNSIASATSHCPPNLSIDYQNTTVENYLSIEGNKGRFDIVTSLEVIEHVNEREEFVKSLGQLLKPDGLLFLSTINKTTKANILTIGIAEYILGVIPKGTHTFNKYVSPENLKNWLKGANCECIKFTGFEFDFFKGEMMESKDLSVNYFVVAKKL